MSNRISNNSKCAFAHMKVSPTDRAHQDEPNYTTFINARPNPATKNAPEVQKHAVSKRLQVSRGTLRR